MMFMVLSVMLFMMISMVSMMVVMGMFFIIGNIEWKCVQQRFSCFLLRIGFNIVNNSVFYTLWLHNDSIEFLVDSPFSLSFPILKF